MNDEQRDEAQPKLLTGGNPQIPKGTGDGPVQAYIRAMPGWKHAVGKRLNELIEAAMPGVQKAVKWNQPLFGMDGETWQFRFRCNAKNVQICFHRGTSLDPVPPKGSKIPEVRYYEIYEGEPLDEELLSTWFRQCAALPGVKM